MSRRASRSVLSLLLALATVGSAGWAWQEHRQSEGREAQRDFEAKRLALLESENARLRGVVAQYGAEKKAAAEAEKRAAIEKQTARIRGLDFRHPVAYDILDRGGIQKVLRRKIDEQFSEAEFQAMEKGYVAMGLLPAGYPLKERYIELLGEQVAAFYDQDTHRLFMYRDAALENGQNRMILSHELTHALQDQHFGLDKLPLTLKTNDDRGLAASALIEGDATLEMQLFLAQDLSLEGIGQSVGQAFTQDMKQLLAAPRILRETLLFPYTEGLRFCMAVRGNRSGFETVSALYSRLPSSSAQILHPEKYFAREEPIVVQWPDLAVRGEKPLFDNVMGEFGTGVLLTDWAGKAAAEAAQGWRGDRYLVFRDGKALVWRSIWSGPVEAERFSQALSKMLAGRYQATPIPVTNTPDAETGTRRIVKFQAKGRVIRVIRLVSPPGSEGAKEKASTVEVVLIDAADDAPEWADALAEKFGR